MHTYQNLTDHELTIPNVGVIPPRGTIQTPHELNSPNLKPITTEQPVPPAPSAPAAQPVQTTPEPPKEGDH